MKVVCFVYILIFLFVCSFVFSLMYFSVIDASASQIKDAVKECSALKYKLDSDYFSLGIKVSVLDLKAELLDCNYKSSHDLSLLEQKKALL